jgi:hypothetical protein
MHRGARCLCVVLSRSRRGAGRLRLFKCHLPANVRTAPKTARELDGVNCCFFQPPASGNEHRWKMLCSFSSRQSVTSVLDLNKTLIGCAVLRRQVVKPKERQVYLRWNVRDFSPFPVAEYRITHSRIQSQKSLFALSSDARDSSLLTDPVPRVRVKAEQMQLNFMTSI